MDIISYEQASLDKTAVALGKFQGLHKGHMLLIDEIKRIAKKEKIKSATFTINMKSDKLLHLPEERFSILNEKGIDYAVECEFSKTFASMTPEEFVRKILIDRLNAAFVCVGTDFRFGYNREGNVDILRSYGIKYGFRVVAFDKLKILNKIVSSSLLRNMIESGNMEDICCYMGRPYSVTGKVQLGKQIGRTIGFPTANIIPDSIKLLPPFGVYETFVNIDDCLYKGITNIGNNPTISSDNRVSIETNIIDFEGDLYNRRLTINFKRFLRPEKRFNNIDELKFQIGKDKERVIMHQ